MGHSHDWTYHHGFLGYESTVCRICHLDWWDSPEGMDRQHEDAVKEDATHV